jgi:hypothetical protein
MWVQITLFLLFFLISKQTTVKKVTHFRDLRQFLDTTLWQYNVFTTKECIFVQL